MNKLSEKQGFKCDHCQNWVYLKAIGTKNRNHCPFCLWSKHVDSLTGDRKSGCEGIMVPIGLTFKKEGVDKYTKKAKQGELMLVHQCANCGKISINRIAGDDDPSAIMRVFNCSLKIPLNIKKELEKQGIDLLKEEDRKEIEKQLGLSLILLE